MIDLRGRLAVMACVLFLGGWCGVWAGEPQPQRIFSGPQAGEKLVPFNAVGVYDEHAGKTLDFVKQAGGKPVMIIFMHKLTRPGAALTRSLLSYAATRGDDGLHRYLVWLPAGGDKSAAEEYLTRARKSLNWPADGLAIAADGEEGPGAYGLNRNVELTILFAKDNLVTANWALVQPSVSEAPAIARSITDMIGGEPPTAEQMTKLSGQNYMSKGREGEMPAPAGGELRPLVVRVIQAGGEEERKQAVEAVEKHVGRDAAKQRELVSLARMILDRGAGGPAMAQQAERWIERYQPADAPTKQDPKSRN